MFDVAFWFDWLLEHGFIEKDPYSVIRNGITVSYVIDLWIVENESGESVYSSFDFEDVISYLSNTKTN